MLRSVKLDLFFILKILHKLIKELYHVRAIAHARVFYDALAVLRFERTRDALEDALCAARLVDGRISLN